MSAQAALRNQVLNLASYRDTLKDALGKALDEAVSAKKTKLVVIESALQKALKNGGVSEDLFRVDKGVVGACTLGDLAEYISCGALVYIARPTPENIRNIYVHLSSYRSRFPDVIVYVYLSPETAMAKHILNNEYNLESSTVEIRELDLGFFPVEDDILSMEMPTDFRDLFLNGDVSVLYQVAKALCNLQVRFGAIPTVKGKGKHAAKIVTIMERLQNEIGASFLAETPAEIEALYVVDRGVDLATPLLTQLTYEGLIEELYGISNGMFDPPFDTATGDSIPYNPDTRRYNPKDASLTNVDTIFAELRDRNYITVGSFLHHKSLEVQATYERRKEVEHLKDLKEFMKALPETQERHRLIGVHTNVATHIRKTTESLVFRQGISHEHNIIQMDEERAVVDYIEDQINKGECITKVLRLMCLFSTVNNGMKPKTYDQLKDALMLAYGIPQIIAALHNLEKCGLLVRQDAKTPFGNMRKAFRLWDDKLNERQPNDPSYAYSGFCPLLSRIIESLVHSSVHHKTAGVADAYDQAGGEKASITNAVEVAGTSRIVVVCIVGGVTAAEVSSLRFIARHLQTLTGDQKHFVFATTSITSGNKIISSLLPFEVADPHKK